MRHKIRGLTAIMLAVTVLMQVQGQESTVALPLQEEERAVLFPSRSDLKDGQSLALTSCAGCHGDSGISQDQNTPNLAGQRPVYLYRQLLAFQQGKRSTEESIHRAVSFLSNQALFQVAAFYSSLEPLLNASSDSESQTAASGAGNDPLLAAKAATTSCAGCHGATGNSNIPGMPNLSAQSPEYFIAAMQSYKGEGIARSHGMMSALVGSLDGATLKAMGLYYALQEPQASSARGSGDAQAGSTPAEACGSCHGADGNSNVAEMPSLAGQDANYFAEAMRAYRSNSRKHTPMVTAVAGLSDTDIENLAAFYAGQQPIQRDVRPPLSTNDWLDRCNRCHGPDGNSTDPRFAALAGQNAGYLRAVLKGYADGSRENSIMHAMSDPISDDEIDKIAAFYTSARPRSVVFLDLPCGDWR